MLQVIIGHTQQMRNIVSTVPPPVSLKTYGLTAMLCAYAEYVLT